MEEKKKEHLRRKYDAAFKAEVLKMVANGQAVAYVSQALGVSESLIYRWKQITKGKENLAFQAGSSPLTLENQQLKERVRQLETERDILKKALAIFSRQT
jgi:transposase